MAAACEEDAIDLDAVELGWKVRLILVGGKEWYEGAVYTVDPVTNTIVLFSKPTNAGTKTDAYDVRLVPSHAVEKIVVLDREADPALAASRETPVVDQKQLAKREQEAFQAMERAMAQLNPNASPEGQAIFDGLNKTMDCTWIQNSIVVLDQVRIEPPYGTDDCFSLDGNQASLDRIRKVLTGIKKKIFKQQQQSQQKLNVEAASDILPSV